MKKAMGLILIFCAILALDACGNSNETVFTATVIENNVSLLVKPQEDSNEYKSSDKITVHAKDADIYDADGKRIELDGIAAGMTLKITYNGIIMESYPAQITASKIEIVE